MQNQVKSGDIRVIKHNYKTWLMQDNILKIQESYF